MLVADLVASGLLLGGIAFTGTPKPPPFEEDTAQVARELTRLLDAEFQTFYLGHGGPISSQAVRAYVGQLERAGHRATP